MRTEELAAADLLQKTREADSFTTDALLAVLAFGSHGDVETIFEAREAGAEVGAIGRGGHELLKRAEANIQ